MSDSSRAGPNPSARKPCPPFDFGTHDQYDFYLRMGPLANANEKYLKKKIVYWNDILKHPAYDEFWQSRAQAPHMKNVTPATLFVGGWFDAEDLSGPLKLSAPLRRRAARLRTRWSWGRGATAAGRAAMATRWAISTSPPRPASSFASTSNCRSSSQNLKGKGDGLKTAPDNEIPKAWVFETGTNNGLRFDHWPPKNAADASRSTSRQRWRCRCRPPAAQAYDEYVSDPAKPVPF